MVLITALTSVSRITAKIDDDMLKYYCNEDLFLLEIKQVEREDAFEVTLIELMDH
jgi:transcription factor CP2-like protein